MMTTQEMRTARQLAEAQIIQSLSDLSAGTGLAVSQLYFHNVETTGLGDEKRRFVYSIQIELVLP